ncbi:MAG TPA: hypothetical protein VKB53_11840 [Gammaproteobacteria bacterium]|jgi:hypothetical protein|nr:hypothetical protein [Gammaproteobacteria bacterium]
MNRIIPQDATAEEFSELGAVIYRNTNVHGKPAARGFKGRASKPSFNYYFASEKNREQYIKIWLQEVRQSVEHKHQREAQKATFKHSLKVGDILVCSWGYDQTNIDYYEVVKVVGSSSVDIRELARESVCDGYNMACRYVPVPGRYIGDIMRKRVQEGNRIKIASYAYASPCEYQVIAGAKIYRSHAYSTYA